MVPIRALAQAADQEPQASLYNSYRAPIIMARRSLAQLGKVWPRWADLQRHCRPATALNGPAPPTGEAAGGRTGIVLGFAILFAYLFLVALYEAGTSRCRCCCPSQSRCWARSVRARYRGLLLTSMPRSVSSCSSPSRPKTASCRRVRRRAAPEQVGRRAAVEGARLRFRPVAVTSFAFISACFPVIATGASALSRAR